MIFSNEARAKLEKTAKRSMNEARKILFFHDLKDVFLCCNTDLHTECKGIRPYQHFNIFAEDIRIIPNTKIL